MDHMKVAISLPDHLFSAAEDAAEELKISRSQLYATALGEFLARRESSSVTDRLNAIHAKNPVNVDAALEAMTLQVLRDETW